MMGTLAKFLAEKGILTSSESYWADVEGLVEDRDGVLRITRILVTYYMTVLAAQVEDARAALASYLKQCPAAQSVIGCIDIRDDAVIDIRRETSAS